MKQLILLTIIFSYPLRNPPLPHQEISKTTYHDNDTKVINNSPGSMIIMEVQGKPLEPPAPKDKESNDNKYLAYGDLINFVMAVATIALAIYAVKQTSATKIAADAARLAAQAAINAERPWLVVCVAPDKDEPRLFRFGCLNQGRTPAKVVSISARPSFAESQYALKIPPDYSTPAESPRLNLIVNTDSFPIEKGVNAEAYIASNGKEGMIASSGEWLYYYGNVVYRDTLYPDTAPEGLHETRWCFFWHPFKKEFLRGGPKEYNHYT